jgi:hypothetical protein
LQAVIPEDWYNGEALLAEMRFHKAVNESHESEWHPSTDRTSLICAVRSISGITEKEMTEHRMNMGTTNGDYMDDFVLRRLCFPRLLQTPLHVGL